LAVVRLGRRRGVEDGRRGRAGRNATPVARATAAVAVVTLVGSAVVVSAPPVWADRQPDRDANRQRRSRHQVPARDGMPARFVAELDGRIVVVSADTGRVERRLTADLPGGGAADPTVTSDGRGVWFSRSDGTCAAHLAWVPVAGGNEQKLPGSGEVAAEGTPLPRPGHPQLAYTRYDCQDSNEALVVGDVRGVEAHGQIGLQPLDWSRDGGHLLAATPDGNEVHLLAISPAGGIVADDVLNPAEPSGDCRLQIVAFTRDGNGGYVAVRRCGPPGREAHRTLVLLDRDGTFRKAVLRLPRGQDFVDRVAFDDSGHSLLYSTAPAEAGGDTGAASDQITLWVWRDGELRRVARQSGYRHPSWLP
jgi:hypothetical protein